QIVQSCEVRCAALTGKSCAMWAYDNQTQKWLKDKKEREAEEKKIKEAKELEEKRIAEEEKRKAEQERLAREEAEKQKRVDAGEKFCTVYPESELCPKWCSLCRGAPAAPPEDPDLVEWQRRLSTQRAQEDAGTSGGSGEGATAGSAGALDQAVREHREHLARLYDKKRREEEAARRRAEQAAERARANSSTDDTWGEVAEVAAVVAEVVLGVSVAVVTEELGRQPTVSDPFPERIDEDWQTTFDLHDPNDPCRSYWAQDLPCPYAQLGYDHCARYRGSRGDYQRCRNDPCSVYAVYVDNGHALQQCRANLYAPAGPSVGGVPTVKPEHMREGVCNTLYDEGSDEPEQYSISVSPGSAGGYVYWYEHFTIRDQARIYLNGREILNTGCTGGSKDEPLPQLSGGGQVTIIIDPKCDPSDSSSTKWQFKLSCP
ncbi:MAG: hypothetical protein VW202_10655, partial [Halieaceae bacterium]